MTDLGYETGTPPPKQQRVLHGPDPTRMGALEHSQWEQVAATEKRITDQIKGDVDRLQRVINTAQRIMVLKNAPGYQQFEKSIEDLRTHAQNEMVSCSESTDRLRILQGRCQAFGSILALMRKTEQNIESLAQQLEAAEAKAEQLIRPDGKVKPETVGDLR